MTVDYADDLGSGFEFEKADHPLFVTSNRCISVKNILGRSAVVFCACEAIHVFSVVFYAISLS
jgi:hypothetical protein